MRLYVNIDHVATIRQARRTFEPDPIAAAREAETAGADGITAHLREDRRHIQDADVRNLMNSVTTVLNLEIACTSEMIRIAEDLRPHQVTFVPERREEITTEGGLDVRAAFDRIREGIQTLNAVGVRTSLFIAPDLDAVRASRELGAVAIEIHTGAYSHQPGDATVEAIRSAASEASRLGLAVHAGHGLTTKNVGRIAEIAVIEEVNIGHHLVSRAVFVGLQNAIREMRQAIQSARGG